MPTKKTKPRQSSKASRSPRKRTASTDSARTEKDLRAHLLYLLQGGGAHLNIEKALTEFPAEVQGIKPAQAPHTPWQLLEHMRIAQWDILDFCRNSNYQELEFPAGYWPETEAPPNPAAWEKSVKSFHADLKAMQDLVANPATDLFARIPHGERQTILREALLVADHNAYHLGQLVLLRRLLGVWDEA